MKIAQIHTGLIEIPPKGWGAVEKVIYNYQKQMVAARHTCDIKYMNEVSVGEYDIVHVHLANQALYLKEKGIPYIFSIHDHHAEHYGKGSEVYNQNHAAIKGSVFSITHAQHYKELFDDCHQLFFLSHGVDTDFYRPFADDVYATFPTWKILMVATNGLAGDITIDRKGFLEGIKIATSTKMNISLLGAEVNEQFAAHYSSFFGQTNVSHFFKNPSHEVILAYYRTAKIFLHLSTIEAGMPNLTLLEALACGCIVVCTGRNFPQTLLQAPNLHMVGKGDDPVDTVRYLKNMKNEEFLYNRIKTIDIIHKHYDWSVIVNKLLHMYQCVRTPVALNTANTTRKYRELLNL